MRKLLIISVILLAASAASEAADLYRPTCSTYTDCATCASNLSWLDTPCRWCPIDRGCHEPGSLVNKCSSQQEVQDPTRCAQEPDNGGNYQFDPRLSELAAALSGAAYAPEPVPCLANYPPAAQAAGPLTDVTKVTQPCDSLHNECSGYVGRLARTKQIVAVFRGTKGSNQLLVEGLMSLTMPKEHWLIGGKVQTYFSNGFKAVWPHMREPLLALLTSYPDYKLLVTGHSLGGAMAALAAANLVTFESVPSSRMAYYTFGEPRVGDYSFATVFDRLVPNSWRVVHGNDLIVHLPICSPVVLSGQSTSGVPFSCGGHLGFPYHHGTEVFFPRTVNMQPGSTDYKVCRGTPINEDSTCANSSDNWNSCLNPSKLNNCVEAHKVYYGVHLGGWWDDNQCTGTSTKKPEPVF